MSKCSPYSCPIGEPSQAPPPRRPHQIEQVDPEVRKRIGLPQIEAQPERFSVEVVRAQEHDPELLEQADALYRRASPNQGSLSSTMPRTQAFWISRVGRSLEG